MPDWTALRSRLRRLGRRFLFLFQRNRAEAEMDEELRLHLELQAAEYREAGMPADAAELRARREFGPIDGIRERCRDEQGILWVSQLRQDLGYAGRMVARSPGFSAIAIATLALGIGVNTAIFSLVDEILLKELPVSDPGSLVLLHWWSKSGMPVPTSGDWEEDPVTHRTTCTSFSLPAFELFDRRNQTMSGLAAFAPINRMTVIADGEAEVARLGQFVSGGYFPVLGVGTAAGRPIGAADDTPAAPAVAMISHAYWLRRFGGDRAVLGKTVLINRVPVTIVGVTPRGFAGTLQVGDAPDFFLPLHLGASLGAFQMIDNPDTLWWVQIIGRRRAGATPTQVGSNFEPAFQQSAQACLRLLGAKGPPLPADLPRLVVGPGGQGLGALRHQYQQRWGVLMGLGTTALVIACANLASLLLARGMARRREIGIRVAMGASRIRIVRQLLTESLLLAGLGGALAVPLAVWVEDALVAMQPAVEGHTLTLDPQLEPRIFLLSAVFSLITGVVFGLVPALRSSQADVTAEFQGGPNHPVGSRSRLGKSLVVAQIALTLVLLVGAGLFSGTLRNLDSVDVGFRPGGLLLFQLDPNPDHARFQAGRATDNQVADRLRAIPGAVSATFSRMPLLSEVGWNIQITVPGQPARPEGDSTAMVNLVGDAFFSTYGMPIIAGRAISRGDMMRGASVAVVNQAFARQFFGSESPVGRTVQRPDYGTPARSLTVIGVARDAKYSAVREPVPPTLYLPFDSEDPSVSAAATFALRVSGNPLAFAALAREAVRGVSPLLPLDELRTQEAQIRDLSATERMFALLSAAFSLLALLLVLLGLYGVMSYTVLRRRAEIGLRIALGARPARVVRMIIVECLLVAAGGVGLGLGGAWAATRVVSNLLYGLSATDPGIFAAGGGLLLLVALLAGMIPAWRAARVDPVTALRAV